MFTAVGGLQRLMSREQLKRRQKKMKPPASVVCPIPLQWRYTVTLSLRELIRSCHNNKNEQGCKAVMECARELGLDVETVVKYTHLEKKEGASCEVSL